MQRVTAAIIRRGDKILIAKRKPGKHQGAKWEFPGGKIDPGESAEACLRRELAEEFSIKARVGDLICVITYREPPIHLELQAYRIESVSGRFRLHEHTELKWVAPEELCGFDLVNSDRLLARRLLESQGGIGKR